MIANRGAAASREDEAAPGEDSSRSTQDDPANPAEAVISAFTAATRSMGGASKDAFDIAVRTYIACCPQTDRDAAARIVAGIISHRS